MNSIEDIKASIGFCGCPYTHPTRKQTLLELDHSDAIQFDSLYTRSFFDHFKFVIKKHRPDLKSEDRELLVNNVRCKLRVNFRQIMNRNIFSFCPRGRGNYSIRFYETLRAGRIPVMVDSDQVFPCEDLIDWDDIIICAKDTEEMIKMVHDWTEHRDLIAIQKDAEKSGNNTYDLNLL